jgi:hypothetical protein
MLPRAVRLELAGIGIQSAASLSLPSIITGIEGYLFESSPMA